MSGTGTLTRARTGARVRFTFQVPDRELSLDGLSATAVGLQSLIECALLEPHRPGQAPSWQGRVIAAVRDAAVAAASAAALSVEASAVGRFHVLDSQRLRQLQSRRAPAPYAVESISYNSPLEIVLYIASGATGATLVGHKILKLWDAWNTSRVRRAESNLAVERHEAQADALRFIRRQFADATEQDPERALNAANVLAALDEVNVLG